MIFSTIGDIIHERARRHGAAPAVLFLERGERPGDSDTYASLDLAARLFGARLLAMNLRGKAVLLACDTGLPFVHAFLGCLYAGVFPIPVPAVIRRERGERLRLVARSAEPAAIIVERKTSAVLKEIGEVPALVLEDEMALSSPMDRPLALTADEIAFIQYTSGSTMEPKGIVITHGNIIANQEMIRQAFRHDDKTVVMSWLPLHHDMGLIGSLLQPLYVGGRCILASPLSFLQRPVRWLRAISDYGATTSGAPNFAYELCARQISPESCETLDLSSWTLAFCGSEPVRPASMQRFASRFALSGFKASALYPCYGMAEATLFITGGTAGQGARSGSFPRKRFADVSTDATDLQTISNCGKAVAPARIALVDTETQAVLAENAVGEICVAGPHVSPGLWAPRSRGGIQPFGQRMIDIDGTPYIRSGDAGIVTDGDLHVVGRLKDMVIVRGANVHAEDIEQTLLEQPEAADIEAIAAIAVERDASEELVLLCELAPRAPRNGLPLSVAKALSRRVSEAHGMAPAEIVLLSPRSIPRTTSGKIQRGQARAAWLDGRLNLSNWVDS